MSADMERRPKARPVLAAALFLLLGAGGGYAFAYASSDEARQGIWPMAAIIAALSVFALMVWHRIAGKTRASNKQSSSTEAAAAPEPTRVEIEAPEAVRRARPDDVLVQLEGPEIDLNTLESLKKLGGDDFVKELMTQFISEGVLTLFKIAQSINEANAADYASQVHALRSSAANVGARRLYRLCLDWRELSDSEIVESGSARFLQLQREFSAAERVLTDLHKITGRHVASVAKAG